MTKGLTNSKTKDSSGKIIFSDAVLCSQFLNGYVNIPILKNVQPGDIEDVTNRFVHMFTEERNSDIVKKIHLKNEKTPFYIISIIEHKNKVDYNVSMQILRYMVYIWEEYEKEMEKKKAGISKTKSFRYPPILPIIFYDGVSNWTASTQLRERIILSDTLLEYIPDFNCILIQLKDYSNYELMKRKNELSVVMMIDRLQNADDFSILEKEVSAEYIQEAVKQSPKYLLDLITQLVEVFLAKMNIPQEEIDVFARQIKEQNMAELFANFKGYDVQETRRIERERTIEEDIRRAVQIIKDINGSMEIAKEQLIDKYELDEATAHEKVGKYWEEEVILKS